MFQDSIKHCCLDFEEAVVVRTWSILSIQQGTHLIHIFPSMIAWDLLRANEPYAFIILPADLQPPYFMGIYTLEFIVVLKLITWRGGRICFRFIDDFHIFQGMRSLDG